MRARSAAAPTPQLFNPLRSLFIRAAFTCDANAVILITMSDIKNYSIPYVIERDGRGNERSFDLYSRLLVDRIIFIGTPIDDQVSNIVVAQLLFMQMTGPKKDIHIYINSPGGSVTSGLAIYDTIQYLTCDVTPIASARRPAWVRCC